MITPSLPTAIPRGMEMDSVATQSELTRGQYDGGPTGLPPLGS